MQDEQLPVVAIGSAGDVTRVNDLARRILEPHFRSRDVSLGALVALLLQREPRSGGIVSLSWGHRSEDSPFTALSIVLSTPGGPRPIEEGTSNGTKLIEQAAPTPDECGVCRLRSPLDTIQRVARGLRRDTAVHLDSANELELLEGEADRALLVVEGLLGLPHMAGCPAGRLNEARPDAAGTAETHPSGSTASRTAR